MVQVMRREATDIAKHALDTEISGERLQCKPKARYMDTLNKDLQDFISKTQVTDVFF